MKPTTPKTHERHEQFRAIMQELNCCLLNECPGPETHPDASRLYFYGVPGKGLLVAQLWSSGSITTLCGWHTGETWQDLRDCLTGKPEAIQSELLTATKAASQFLQCHIRAQETAAEAKQYDQTHQTELDV